MKRLHVHVAVDDLAASIKFYSTMFAAEPTVTKGDYAKWMLDDPRVNFAISARGAAAGLNHLGVQVENADELAEMNARLQTARRRGGGGNGHRLLLRQVGQVLGDRPHRHRLGDLSHARQHPGVRRGVGRRLLRARACSGKSRLLHPGPVGRGRLLLSFSFIHQGSHRG